MLYFPMGIFFSQYHVGKICGVGWVLHGLRSQFVDESKINKKIGPIPHAQQHTHTCGSMHASIHSTEKEEPSAAAASFHRRDKLVFPTANHDGVAGGGGAPN